MLFVIDKDFASKIKSTEYGSCKHVIAITIPQKTMSRAEDETSFPKEIDLRILIAVLCRFSQFAHALNILEFQKTISNYAFF